MQIRKILKDDDLHSVGCYVQTCAHIEHLMWLYMWLEKPAHPKDEAAKKRIMELRLSTTSLIDHCEKHIKKISDR